MIDSKQLHTTHSSTPPKPISKIPHPDRQPRPPVQIPPRHHRVRWTIVSLSVVVIIFLSVGGWLAYRAISVINTKRLDGSKLSFFQQLTRIVTSNGDQLQGEADDRVNILLLGYGGPGHDGPYLTDTMMIVSFQPSTKRVALISIPRDLVIDIPGYDYRKINSVLSFGRDQKYPGGGEAFTVKAVRDLVDLPIQYYARVDFSGFQDVIDQVGGVNIQVDTTFSDFLYPDNAYGYDPISFKAGLQMMSGEQALKFSRSRHGNNGEGSDFARATRQQKIIIALKDKLLSFGTLSNPKKISDVLGSLGSHSQTNMEIWEMLRLAKMAGGINADQIINKVFDDSPTGFLRAATGNGGAFILVPRSGNYRDLQFLTKYIFLVGTAEKEGATILILNASKFPNLGATYKQVLQSLNVQAIKASSLTGPTINQTVLVSARPGQYPLTEKLLALYTRSQGTLDLATWTTQSGDTTLTTALATPITTNTNWATATGTPPSKIPDLILVLGLDQLKPQISTSPAVVSPPATNTNSATNTNTKSSNSNSAIKNSTNGSNTNAETTNTNVSTTTNTATNLNTSSNANSSTNQ